MTQMFGHYLAKVSNRPSRQRVEGAEIGSEVRGEEQPLSTPIIYRLGKNIALSNPVGTQEMLTLVRTA